MTDQALHARALMVAQVWLLKRIRETPGETHEELTIQCAKEFRQTVEIGVDHTAGWMQAFRDAGFIYSANNNELEDVWLYREPPPAPRSGLRRIVIETPNSRLQAFTSRDVESVAKDLEQAKDRPMIFHSLTGEPAVIVRPQEVYSIAFDPDEIPTALQ